MWLIYIYICKVTAHTHFKAQGVFGFDMWESIHLISLALIIWSYSDVFLCRAHIYIWWCNNPAFRALSAPWCLFKLNQNVSEKDSEQKMPSFFFVAPLSYATFSSATCWTGAPCALCSVHNVGDQISQKSQYYMCPVSTVCVDSRSIRGAPAGIERINSRRTRMSRRRILKLVHHFGQTVHGTEWTVGSLPVYERDSGVLGLISKSLYIQLLYILTCSLVSS